MDGNLVIYVDVLSLKVRRSINRDVCVGRRVLYIFCILLGAKTILFWRANVLTVLEFSRCKNQKQCWTLLQASKVRRSGQLTNNSSEEFFLQDPNVLQNSIY